MPNLRFIAIAAGTPDLLASDGSRFEAEHGVRLGSNDEHVAHLRWIVDLVLKIDAPPPWGGYLAADADTGELLGTCGFKGGPDADGMVEIGYGTFAPHEGRGVATAMAARLVEIAAGEVEARIVRAHTLPEINASGCVLTRNGFTRIGETVDPEDGRVWRWERAPRQVESGT